MRDSSVRRFQRPSTGYEQSLRKIQKRASQKHDQTMSDDDARVYDQETIDKAFEEALDDVHTRFILNLPPEELSSTDRIFFQLEQA